MAIHNTGAALQSLWPEALAERIDWQTLALDDGSFIDPQLAERQSDLLYSVQLEARPVLLYLLLEHQSSSERWMPLRMLVYLTRIWDRHREQQPYAKHLPPIVPLVLHHSAQGWTAPTSLGELLDADRALLSSLEPYVFDFQFRLVDLTREDDRILHGWLTTDLGKLVALCLKHAPYEALLEKRLKEWLELMGRVARAPGGVAGLQVIGRYLLEVNDITPDRIRLVLESALDSGALEAVMTGAERLLEQGRAEGEAKGRAEGEAKGRAEIVLTLLNQRFGPLSAETAARVSMASTADLLRFTERALNASSLDEVLE